MESIGYVANPMVHGSNMQDIWLMLLIKSLK